MTEAVLPVAATRHRPLAPRRTGDRLWRLLLALLGLGVVLALFFVARELWELSRPSLRRFGLSFLSSTDWDPTSDAFGALPFAVGTLWTTAIALLLAAPVGLGGAIFLAEMAPPRLRAVLRFPIELLAAIPSVVYGLWGLFVVAPLLRDRVEPRLGALGLSIFEGPPVGVGILCAGLVLAVMVLPTLVSLSIDVLVAVPRPQREGLYALGATRWEAIRLGVLPTARPGLFGAGMLALGRALGETMAVTMVIGNSPELPRSLFATGATLSSVIANELTEAVSPLHQAALAELGLVLLGGTLAVSAVGRLLVRRTLA